jgi:translation initiation factor 2 subunit 3
LKPDSEFGEVPDLDLGAIGLGEEKAETKEEVKIDLNEVMQNQPLVIIGTVGHVADGKSTIVKYLSGKATQCFASELLQGGKTIKLGYANAKIFKCDICPKPKCFRAGPSRDREMICLHCDNDMKLYTHVSFIDCPGHHKLTSTMWSGACLMDYTLLVESITNEKIPAPQTMEHLVATSMAGIDNAAVCLNKIDMLPKKEGILEKIRELKGFVDKFIPDTNVIPTSAVFGINMDVLCEYLASVPVKPRNINAYGKMIGIRSFDINKPKTLKPKDELKGGTIGGSLLQGIFRIGDTVLIYPGYTKSIGEENTTLKNKKTKEKIEFKYKNWTYHPIEANILSIRSEEESLELAYPGALVGIQLDLDPGNLHNDALAGNIVVHKDSDHSLRVTDKLILKIDDMFPDVVHNTIPEFKCNAGDRIGVHVNSDKVDATIKKYSKSSAEIQLFLDAPVAVDLETKVVLSDYKSGNIFCKCSILDLVDCDAI